MRRDATRRAAMAQQTRAAGGSARERARVEVGDDRAHELVARAVEDAVDLLRPPARWLGNAPAGKRRYIIRAKRTRDAQPEPVLSTPVRAYRGLAGVEGVGRVPLHDSDALQYYPILELHSQCPLRQTNK
jgi:hypothetical protein